MNNWQTKFMMFLSMSQFSKKVGVPNKSWISSLNKWYLDSIQKIKINQFFSSSQVYVL